MEPVILRLNPESEAIIDGASRMQRFATTVDVIISLREDEP